jgi:hypothetical protein
MAAACSTLAPFCGQAAEGERGVSDGQHTIWREACSRVRNVWLLAATRYLEADEEVKGVAIEEQI